MINYRCFFLFQTYDGFYRCKYGDFVDYKTQCERCLKCKEKAKK